jgi:L-threonylcarbamoyladenylate synthase
MTPEVERAVQALRQGGLVALPTETVYGLAANAEDELAVRRIFAVKGRPASHPVIVHLGDPGLLDDWASEVTHVARQLAAAFWPGPLTLVVKRSARALDVVTAGQDTVALRVPRHPLTLEVLRAFGGAVAAPSANRFGKVSPTTAAHVREDLGSDVDLVLDGGPCEIGLESTIVDVTSESPRLLRPGGVAAEAIEERLGRPLDRAAPAGIRAPGLLPSHYAPSAGVVLATEEEAAGIAARLQQQGKRVGLLASGRMSVGEGIERLLLALYARLREADTRGLDVIVAVLPPEVGLGVALRDRLTRAARRT